MPLENQPNSNMRPQPPGFDKDPPDVGTINPSYPHAPGVGSRGQGTRGAPFGASGHAVGGGAELWYAGDERDDTSEEDEEGDDTEQSPHDREDQPDWEKRAQDAMRFSTTYLDSNYRQKWDDSLRAFNNQHPADSKYNGENFKKRSHLFVPVTRTVIRKNEAAACKAFFSNHDVASIRALNEGDPRQVASAAMMKELVQYRCKHTLHWFQFLIGGLQDAQKQGACVANVEWVYQSRRNVNGKLVTSKDQPVTRLTPLENMRFDPSASWMDPFNDSPYLIELVQMYVGDVKAKMARPDPKGRKWKTYSDTEIRTSSPDDSTRQARLGMQQDPAQENRSISDYEVCWVQRHIHRWDGNDWHFWTLSDGKLLTDPELLEHVVFHGRRPYILGFAVLETHKPLPCSVPELVKPLQDAINGLENQRNDNVLFALNKRHKVKRGANVDTVALLRNVPGGIVNVDNMEDLEELPTPDVTASSYQEEDRKRQAFDDLVGNFNPMQLHQAGAPREAQGTVRMLQGPASEMTEYMLQTYAITFVVEVLRHLVLLEQHYETDKKVLAIAGQKAKLLQKFGQDEVTDEMLAQELTTEVNVGMGSTDTTAMLARLVYAMREYAQLAKIAPPGINLAEILKEFMSLSGYQDGERFSTQGNAEMAKLEQVNKQLMQMVQDLKRHKNDKEQGNILNFVAKREAIQARERMEASKGKHQIAHTYAQHLLDQDDALLQHALGGLAAEQQGQQQAQLSAQNAQQQQEAAAAAPPKPAA
jgi:hypothetical protein